MGLPGRFQIFDLFSEFWRELGIFPEFCLTYELEKLVQIREEAKRPIPAPRIKKQRPVPIPRTKSTVKRIISSKILYP